MATGRCAGCAFTGPCRKVEQHALTCAAYRAQFRIDPQRCPDPASAHARYLAGLDSATRAHQRDLALRTRFADVATQQANAALRWATPPDILAD